MNVALCISGVMRNDLVTLQNIQKNIIDPLNADVFIQTWDQYYSWGGLGGAGELSFRIWGITGEKTLPKELNNKHGLKKYFPRAYRKLNSEIYEPLDINKITSLVKTTMIRVSNSKDFEQFVLSYFDNQSINQLKMFYLMYLCNKMLDTYSNSIGKKYDYVIRIRPDISIETKFTFELLKNIPNNHVGIEIYEYGPNDQIFISNYKTMNVLCNLWEESIKKKRLSPFDAYKDVISHKLLFLWMVRNSILPHQIKINRYIWKSTYKAFPDIQLELKEDFKNEGIDYLDNKNVKIFFDFVHQRKYEVK